VGAVRETITPALADFIAAQHVFFVATAPSGADGHVNVSPKGLDTFAVIDERRVAYLDLTGSGVETIAHLRDNGRITIMFCAFEGNPTILRLYGRGEAIPVDDPRSAPLLTRFKPFPGARSVIVVDVERVSTSCGYAVPLMTFERERDRLIEWAEKKGDAGIVDYRVEKNAASIDGLPGLDGRPD
jgi:hypothetical protein